MWRLVIILAVIVAAFGRAAVPIAQRVPGLDSTADGDSFVIGVTSDERHCLLTSSARNLVTNKLAGRRLELFAADLWSSNVVAISAGREAFGGVGEILGASASSNAATIAFLAEVEGWNSNHVTILTPQVFVRDAASGTMRIISAHTNGYSYGYIDRSATNGMPVVSAAGRYVFFDSTASNLTFAAATPYFYPATDTNGVADVFRFDTWSNRYAVVSARFGTNVPANAASTLASVTPDGTRVAFISVATDLTTNGPLLSQGDVYVRDMVSTQTVWASSLSNFVSGVGSYTCTGASISDNGDFVAITAMVGDNRILFLRGLDGEVTQLVSSNVAFGSVPQISADGRYVSYEDGTNVYRWDRTDTSRLVVNARHDGLLPTNGVAREARMSADGRRIAFVSNSGELAGTESAGTFQIYVRDMWEGNPRLVTTLPDGAPDTCKGAGGAFALTPSGNAIVFDSVSENLVVGDDNRASDVFLRDIAASTTSCLSRRLSVYPARQTTLGHTALTASGVSSNGSVVAVLAWDGDWVPGDTNQAPDVFLLDRSNGTVTAPPLLMSNGVRAAAVSADGRYLAYVRRSAGDTNEELWRFDRQIGTNELLLRAAARRGDIAAPAISSDGSLLSYISNATLVVLNMQTRSNELVAAQASAIQSSDLRDALISPNAQFVTYFQGGVLRCWNRQSGQSVVVTTGTVARVSADSRYLLVQDGYLFNPRLSRWNLLTSTSTPFGFPYRNADITADGQAVVAEDPNNTQIVFLDDPDKPGTMITTNAVGQPGNRASKWPVISGDGRFVAWLTSASNLLPGSTNRALWQLAVRDRLLGFTTLLSAGPEGVAGDASSARPFFSADGRTLFFESAAANLSPGDNNRASDVFSVSLGADSDSDGMDDDWEVAFFGDLSRTADGDEDGDGVSNRDEFVAGTDPTNQRSAFRVVIVRLVGTNFGTATWSGDPRCTYRLEYKSDVAQSWTPYTGPITWNGTTASMTVDLLTLKAFFRAVKVQ